MNPGVKTHLAIAPWRQHRKRIRPYNLVACPLAALIETL
jgi:hypothetical protein